MKFIHLSDLHIGKRVSEFSMLEDQKYILKKILDITSAEKPDCILIAGDVYDKTVPPAEAVEIFDDFIVKLKKMKTEIFIISGNHDCAERLAFGGRIMDSEGVHFSPVYNGSVNPKTIKDSFGNINIYMLPFIKPVSVRRYFPEEEISSYNDAVKAAISHMQIDKSERNILITHQLVTGAVRSDSEEISVGGIDDIDREVLEDFDYVALGHLHGPQNIGNGKIRYCGTPLKYSFSEAGQKKSVTVGEIGEKGSLDIKTVPLVPLRNMVEIRGKYEEITLKSFYENTSYNEDYMHITLTDEEDIPEAISKLRVIYKNLMKLDYDNTRTRHNVSVSGAVNVEKKLPIELFEEFYILQNGSGMSDKQREYMSRMTEDVWGEK